MGAPQFAQNLVSSAVGTGGGDGSLASPSAAVPPFLLPFLRRTKTTPIIMIPIIRIKENSVTERPSMLIDVDAAAVVIVSLEDSEVVVCGVIVVCGFVGRV